MFQIQDYRSSDALNLVRWTILVDTVNLSEAAKKATDDDVRILRKIEKLIPDSENTRYYVHCVFYSSKMSFNVYWTGLGLDTYELFTVNEASSL